MINDTEIEQRLEELRGESVPELPKNMQSRVWRSIHRREESSPPVFFHWPLWLAQPVMALIFLVGATGFGFLYEATNYEAGGHDSASGKIAWADAFDMNSLYLPPQTLTGRRR